MVSSTQKTKKWTASDLRQWLVRELASKLHLEADQLDPRREMHRYGLTSLAATALVKALGNVLERKLSPTLIWAHPTIAALADHLAGSVGKASFRDTEPPRIRENVSRQEPVAVVGMACRFPGATGPSSFWDLLRTGRHAVGEIPESRWQAGRFYHPNPEKPGKMNTRWGGFIDHIDRFDPLFFGISPREAVNLDPQQRLGLKLAWEALEDGGLAPDRLKGTKTGVFMGVIWHDYGDLTAQQMESISLHTGTGVANNLVANRISYALDLRGTSLALDTACSSSLVALHLACQSLQSGESRMALAGGVNLILNPATMVALSKFGGLAPDNRCKSFDAAANGFVRGEGGGVMFLKPLSRAVADGDRIYCLIRGGATNNDGASNGLTAPNPLAQEAVLREAYANAGVNPAEVRYVEAHGAGTVLGDPIEVTALGNVLAGPLRPKTKQLRIGSVKSNLGHLEGAAGIAGAMKAALALHHRKLPPSLHFQNPNPHIPFDSLRVSVQQRLTAWPKGEGTPLAGISSFGWGGTNCHLVVQGDQEAPFGKSALKQMLTSQTATKGPGGKMVFVFSPQGGQWRGMGRQLLRTQPAFAAAIRRLDQSFRKRANFSLMEELVQPQDSPPWKGVDIIQPLIQAVQLGLAELLQSWGITPDAVVGHSLGEVVAAHVAGALSLEDTALVMAEYGRAQAKTEGTGGMALLGVDPNQVPALLAPYHGALTLACYNGPDSTVVSGPDEHLESLVKDLQKQGYFARKIDVAVAAHSQALDPILAELEQSLEAIRPQNTAIPMISTLTGEPIKGTDLTAGYWPRNLRQPVLFGPAMKHLVDGGHDWFLELNPHPILLPGIQQLLKPLDRDTCALGTMAGGEREISALVETLTELHRLKVPIRWSRVVPGGVPGFASVRRSREPLCLILSAHNHVTLQAWARVVMAELDGMTLASLPDFCYNLARHRAHHDCRLGIVARSPREFRAALKDYLEENSTSRVLAGDVGGEGSRKIAFVFPGQGSQWAGMALDLCRRQPEFRKSLKRIANLVDPHLDRPLFEILEGEPDGSFSERVDLVQPALFAVQVALADLWRSFGVEPDAVVGHSMGEAAAAHIAGALSLQDAVAIICKRSRLMHRTSGQGAMAAVELTLEQAAEVIADYAGTVGIAANNGPTATVLSGEKAHLAAILKTLEEREVWCRWIKVDLAAHGPQMDALLPDLQEAISQIAPRPSELPLYSTVTGQRVDDVLLDVSYWCRNLREPVRFAEAASCLRQDGFDTFLEISPHTILLPTLEQWMPDDDTKMRSIESMRRGESACETVLAGLSELYCSGFEVNWDGVFPRGGFRMTLPAYPWQEESYWYEGPAPSFQGTRGNLPEEGDHPLLQWPISVAVEPNRRFWQTNLGSPPLAYLSDHRLQETVVLPASAWLEMALSGYRQSWNKPRPVLVDLVFDQPLLLEAPTKQEIQMVFEDGSQMGPERFLAFSRSRIEGEGAWIAHGSGKFQLPGPKPEDEARPDDLRRQMVDRVDGPAFYERVKAAGLSYGPGFQGVCALHWAEGRALGAIEMPADLQGDEHFYEFHPALFDACLQVLLGCLPQFSDGDRDKDTYVTSAMDRVELVGPIPNKLWSYARLRPTSTPDGDRIADLTLWNQDQQVLGTLSGVHLKRIARAPVPDQEPAAGVQSLREELLGLPREDALAGLETFLREQAAKVLRLKPSQMNLKTPLSSMGLTSLMAMELRNRLNRTLQLSLSATVIWNYPTLARMAPYLAEKLGLTGENAKSVAKKPPVVTRTEPNPTKLPANETEEALLEELDALEALLNGP